MLDTRSTSIPRWDPARIDPPDQPLPLLRLLRTVVDNPVKTWPRAVYRERLFRTRVLGRDIIFVMAPDLIRQVLVDEAENFPKHELARRTLGSALGDSIIIAEGPRWRWQRRVVAPIFRQERIRGFVPAMIAAAERTRDRWLAYPPRVEIDVSSEMIRTTFDIIINTLLPARNSIDYALMQKSITDYIGSFSWIVALGMMRAPRWLPFPGIRAARRGRDYLHRALDLLIAEEKRSPGKGSDLLSLLASTTDPETGKSMHDTDVRNNLLGFFAAGHETTAIALTWTFYLLSLHPEVEQRVKREIAGVTGGAPLLPEQVEMLPYTLQVIQEAMRLYPPLPLIGRQARQGARIGNEDVRAGTAVYIPVYAVHRHEAYWREPDEFDPGRFERQAVKALDRYTYLPFGAGPRICIGQTFGELEATAILATLLNSFQLSLRPGYIPEPRYQITLRPRHGMPMRISTPSSRN